MVAARQRLLTRPSASPEGPKRRRSGVRILVYSLATIVLLAAILVALAFALDWPGMSKLYRP